MARKGTPHLFFVAHRKTRGKWSQSAISEVEETLIAFAAAKNPNLTNKRSLPNQSWSIDGIIASRGAPTVEARAFKKFMGI
jgi:hypothetical protein